MVMNMVNPLLIFGIAAAGIYKPDIPSGTSSMVKCFTSTGSGCTAVQVDAWKAKTDHFCRDKTDVKSCIPGSVGEYPKCEKCGFIFSMDDRDSWLVHLVDGEKERPNATYLGLEQCQKNFHALQDQCTDAQGQFFGGILLDDGLWWQYNVTANQCFVDQSRGF